MHIGFDFDNTIVSYDTLFHKVALEKGFINKDVAVNKIAVREFLKNIDKEVLWTEMQGYVYGARMDEAQSYPNVLSVMRQLRNKGHTLSIISHKTKFPFLGVQYDLHQAARSWITEKLKDNQGLLIDHIFFELTKEEKLSRIALLKCDVFVDDLPEILLGQGFPTTTQKYLFDPENYYMNHNFENVNIISTWDQLGGFL